MTLWPQKRRLIILLIQAQRFSCRAFWQQMIYLQALNALPQSVPKPPLV